MTVIGHYHDTAMELMPNGRPHPTVDNNPSSILLPGMPGQTWRTPWLHNQYKNDPFCYAVV